MRSLFPVAVPAISAVLIAGSASGILLDSAYRNNSRVEAAFCRFHICATTQLIDRARARRLDLSHEAAALGWEESREALRRDPASAHRWCDAGESLALLGESQQAERAFHRAVELAPASPPILLRAAGFAWRTGHSEDALALSSRILHLIRAYDSVVFLSYARSDLPIDTLLRAGIPPDPAAAQSFFESTLAAGNPERARPVWEWIAARGYATNSLAARYLDLLLAHHLYAEALSTWTAYTGDARGDYPSRNLLFNGSFESDFSGAPLDWTPSRADHVQEQRDSLNARAGTWSLRVTFDGAANLDYRGISQKAIVAPGPFHFSAWVKLDGLTTDRGIAFRIFDPESPSRLDVRTRMLTGTMDWSLLEVYFTVRSGTNLLQIEPFREPSWKFDNKLAGTAWIDAVELTRAALKM